MTSASDEFGLAPTRGTLHTRALEAARLQLEAVGAERLHLREIADGAGSAVASLYYHFTDKDGLLADLAVQGWQELARDIAEAMGQGQSAHRIDAASSAYLNFIQGHPQLYALMQGPQMLAANVGVRDAERQAFAIFQSALADDERAPEEERENVALMMWVLGRGIGAAMLTQGEADADAAGRLREQVLSGFRFLLSPRFRRA